MRIKEYHSIGERTYVQKLENGLTVMLIKKTGFNKSSAFFATNYGGGDRRFRYGGEWIDTPAGVAHFLEHKMFDMPDGRNVLMEFSSQSASANAFTSSEITAYLFESTDRFEDNLKLLLEYVSTPYFTEESVLKEQGIIGQEIHMVKDRPATVCYYGLIKNLFQHNPIKDDVVGTVESIAQITSETLYKCHKIFYNPSNMILCVAGDQEFENILEIARETLPQQAGEVPESDYGQEERDLPAAPRGEKIMEVSIPRFFMGSKVRLKEKGAERFRQILTGDLAMRLVCGKSSPLYVRLYSQGLINPDFGCYFNTSKDVAFTMCGGESKDPDAVKDAILKEAAALTEKADGELFTRIKKAATGQRIIELDSFIDMCYNIAGAYFDGYDYLEVDRLLEGISLEEVQEFIKEAFKPEKNSIFVINPR